MNMTSFTSSQVAEAGYDPENKVLRVRFHSGQTYDYQNVSSEQWDAMLKAESVGKWFSVHIKGHFTHPFAKAKEGEE